MSLENTPPSIKNLYQGLDIIAASYVDNITDPYKPFAHDLRAAACQTYAQELAYVSLGQLPKQDTFVTDDLLKTLSDRVPACFQAMIAIGQKMVDRPEPNSPFEQFLETHFGSFRATDQEAYESFLYFARDKTTWTIQAQQTSKEIIPAYLKLLSDKYRETSQNNLTFEKLQELAQNSLEIINRLAFALNQDMRAVLSQITVNREPLIFNINDFILLTSQKRVTFSSSATATLHNLHLHRRGDQGVTGCPALPDLISLLVKKTVSE